MPYLLKISSKKTKFALLSLFFCLLFLNTSQADSSRNIPPGACDFYGTEELQGALKKGSIITAKGPNGTIIGQFTLVTDGKYGFLSCLADDPNTPEVDGALDGDTISFYIDGLKQQKQAIWKLKEAVRVDLGIPAEEGAFNLHLLDVPGYTNFENNPNFSGAAVADMIIDYLVPANSDTQQALMSFADLNANNALSSSELERLLNQKVGKPYNFGSTATIDQYSNWGIIDKFDATNQADCIKQICHWLAYKVPDVTVGKEYVPVAISTSANPAINADSDYSHWMSVVGIKTNQDPFPNLAANASAREEYRSPQVLQLYGVYLNDPGQSGLGFHTYMASDVWLAQYFRPLANGLEAAGEYVAIMEPPDPKAASVQVAQATTNSNLEAVLEAPEKGISVFIPKALDKRVKDYLLTLLKQLKQSPEFSTLIDDPYFGEALKGAQVNRSFKVDGKANPDYTIVPFEKRIDNKLATTLAVVVNNESGQFQMASADNKNPSFFTPLPWYDAYKALRKQIGWGEYPVKYWQSNSSGTALFPDWSFLTFKYEQRNPIEVLSTNEYTVTAKGKVSLEKSSPGVEILSTEVIPSGSEWIKLVSFKVSSAQKYSVEINKAIQQGESSLIRNEDSWLLILKDAKDTSCLVEIKSTYSTYLYIRK